VLRTTGCTINKGLTNSNNEYFYILKAGFSKKEISTQLISVRIIFSIILVLMASIFYLVSNQFKQRALHLFSLKHQAQQIHHDIANPVQSVDWGINQMILEKKHNENKLIKLRDSVGMIKGIIHDLYYLHDNKFQRKELVKSAELLYPILDSVVSSARLFISNDMQVILQKSNNWNILVNIDNIVLRRALLNLVKNSVEALSKNGIVSIAFSKQQHNAIIKISDNGIGMNEKTVQKLLEGKSTIHSKDTGRGLGFSYAKQAIESFGGNIAIQSKLNKGTKQVINLPIEAKKPIWFVDKIDLEKYKTLVIFDDNQNIHEIYKQKFNDKKLIHFSTVNEFERHMININNRNNAFFFIDYALNVIVPNGIDLIKRYQLEADSILVTNMYLEKGVKDKCLQCGIKILPKGMIEFI
jgi:nitrogen-specific signal transduction histidine kinase